MTGVEIFERLRRERRGVLFSFMHHGHFAGSFPSFAARGVRVHVAVAPHYFGEPDTGKFRGYDGRRDRAHITTVRGNGNGVFLARGSSGHMRELLLRGDVVALAHDLPGGTETTWLGRRVSFASGLPRLALETGAAIVPVSASPAGRRGLTTRFRAQEPIDPSDYSNVSDLLGAITERHEPAVRAWPEAVDNPVTRCYAVEPADAERFGAELAPPRVSPGETTRA